MHEEKPARAGVRDDAVDAGKQRLPCRSSLSFSMVARGAAVIVGLIGAIAAQEHLSKLARSRVDAAHAHASALTVALSLLAPALVAVALWQPSISSVPMARLWLSGVRAPPSDILSHGQIALTSLRQRILNALAAHVRGADPRAMTRRGRIQALLLLGAWSASIAADLGARAVASRPVAQWWWVASVALLVLSAGAPLLSRASPVLRKGELLRASRAALTDIMPLAFVLGIALWLRLPNLAQLPYVVHGDEAACGLQALQWLHGQIPSLLDTGWYGLPVAGYGLPALVMRVFGANLYGLRLSSVLIGVVSIAGTYAFAREFGGRRFAAVAAGLLAVSHAHIQFSRIGIHYIHAVCVVVLTLWLLMRALRRGSIVAAVLAGVGMSLALQVYFSARIVFIVVPLILVGIVLLRRDGLRTYGRAIAWFAMSVVISIGPLAVYFAANPAPLQDRTNEVFIFSSDQAVRVHVKSQFGTAALGPVLQRQIAAVPLLLGGLADQSVQYGPQTALFDPLIAALAVAGFFYAILHVRRLPFAVLVVWVSTTIISGGVLTIDMPWWPRLVVMLPALCILAAQVVELLARDVTAGYLRVASFIALAARRHLLINLLAAAFGGILAIGVVGASAAQSIPHYFVDYQRLVNSDPWRTRFTDVGRYAAQVQPGTYVVLYTHDDVDLRYDTIQFLAPVEGQTVQTNIEVQKAVSAHHGQTVVIIMPSAQGDFQRLLTQPGALPVGAFHVHPGASGAAVFDTYVIGESGY